MPISLNPGVTTNAPGLFGLNSWGLVQGTYYDDPSSRNWLAGGVVAPTETLPMFGGIGISENIPLSTGSGATGGATASETQGGYIGRATSIPGTANGALTGFSIINQMYNAITTPQSTAPYVTSGQGVNFMRIGTNARVHVKADPALVALDGSIISQQVSWDFGSQMLVPFQAAYAANVITAATWASTSGGQATYTTTSPHGIGVGKWVTFSGMTPAGYNGTFLTVTGTTGSTIVVANTVNPGASTVQGTLVAGGGALPVRVLEVQPTGCMVINYNSTTTFATWNGNGSCATILI